MTSREDPKPARKLDAEDRALWDEVTRSLKPLRGRAAAPSAPRPKPLRSAPSARPRPPVPAAAPASLDRRLKRRLARGVAAVDDRLDLHGMTQAQAHSSLLRFLRRAQAGGARLVLVITGKGAARSVAARDPGTGSGTLRRQVPRWLGLPPFHPYVSACEQAGPAHGGEGALYIRIRRQVHAPSA